MTQPDAPAPEHSPTPWSVSNAEGGWTLVVSGSDVVAFMGEPPDDPLVTHNAAFIVRAVNAYAALVEALEPFAAFHGAGAWRGSVWENAPDDCAVLYRHATGKQIAIGDFKRAATALALAKDKTP